MDFIDASGYSVRDCRVFDHRGDEVFVPTSIYNLLVSYGRSLEAHSIDEIGGSK